MEIKHPEWLQSVGDSPKLYGYNQEWYGTSFQRTRGCGPTAASMLLLYLNLREGEPLFYKNHSIATITKILEDVWTFITPNWLLGLSSTGKFCRGMEGLLAHYKLSWQCRELSISAFKFKRPPLVQVIAFLEKGLSSDCPIAFLNLQRGKESRLASWHWIVLIAIEFNENEKRYMATCYDNGYIVHFDVGLWLETTKLGGGFVYLTLGSRTNHQE